MAVCKENILFTILISYAALFTMGANANELLMQTFSRVLSLDKRIDDLENEFRKSLTDVNSFDERMDNLEIKLENSVTDLQTKLAKVFERNAEIQKNYEPKLGGITKSFQSTIPNTMTQMVKSQYIAISTAMKREKVALMSLKTEMKKHMKAIGDEFQIGQRNLKDDFLNQSIFIEDQIRAQKENVTDVMKDAIIETNKHQNQMKIDFENAKSSFGERFINQSKAMEYMFKRQSDDVGKLISDARIEREHLKGDFVDAQNSLNKAIDTIKKETKTTTFNLQQTLNENLKTMQSEVNLRFTNQEHLIASLNSTIGSTVESLQDYRSSCNSIRANLSSLTNRVSSAEKRLLVNGQWGSWGGWKRCDTHCESNKWFRERLCNDPAPLNGVASCSGNDIEIGAFVDCSEIRQNIGRVPSGVYHITTWKTNQTAPVFCDMDTDRGGWTVFQHRVDGSVDFYRNFSSYENGFGSPQDEFWLGLKLMHEMTSRATHDLRIDITRANDSTGYVVYADFSVGAGSDYTLHVGKSLSEKGVITRGKSDFNVYQNGSAFSTFDHDNDDYHCAVDYHGAWWYNGIYCFGYANLNGLYYTPGTRVNNYTAMIFDSSESLKTSRMMFRHSV